LPSTSLPLSLPTSTTASSSSSRHLFFSTTSSSLEEEENARRNAENAGRQQQRLAEASLSRARNSTSPLLSASGGGDPLSRAPAGLPPGARIHSDFFGEPVTFLDGQSSASSTSADTASPSPDIAPAVASLDGFLIGIVSRGKAFTGGGEEQGISAQAYHSAALAWSDLIRHASVWNGDDACCPMLVHAAVAPVLAQSGAAYVRHLDRVLEHVDLGVDNGNTTVSLMQLAEKAVAAIQSNDNGNDKDNNNDRSVPPLTPREITHLTALGCLLRNDHRRAMLVLYRHVQVCPGDALALSLLLDVCHTVGDTGIAMRGAAAVAAYWSERGGGMIRPSGHGAVAGLIAVGLAVGGRTAEAEALAIEHAGSKRSLAAGVATWAMAHVLDSGGRTAEGVSACANLDGSERYEDCGFLGFDAVLAGYGVRFALDREDRGGRSRGSAALRLYDTHYGAVLEGSGYSNANASSGHDKPHQRAPIGWRRSRFEASNRAQELMAEVFGKEQRSVYERESSNAGANNQNENNENERNGNGVGNENENNNEQQASSSYTTMSYGDTTTNGNNNNNNNNNNNGIDTHDHDHNDAIDIGAIDDDWKYSMEDVLTWLPPSPQFLSDATLLMLRFTLNGTLSCSNHRWEHLRNAWSIHLEIEANNRCTMERGGDGNGDEDDDDDNPEPGSVDLTFYPLACAAASLVAEPGVVGELPGAGGRLQAGLHKMGRLLDLGAVDVDVDNSSSNGNGNDNAVSTNSNNNNNYLSTVLFKDIVADKEPDFWLPVVEEAEREEWKTVLKLLSSATDGIYDPTGEDDHDITKATLDGSNGAFGWEFDVRPFLEHAVVYAACKCGDYQSLSIARSICSRGVTLRSNSPEEWWRYSIVLGLLGDETASEDALNASHSFGGGQGSRL